MGKDGVRVMINALTGGCGTVGAGGRNFGAGPQGQGGGRFYLEKCFTLLRYST